MRPPSYRGPQRPQPFPVPTAVRKLPLNLQRTALVTQRPDLTARAIQEWQQYMAGKPQPQMLPQALMFQQWKRGPGGATRGSFKRWDQSAESVMRAMQHVQTTSTRRYDSYGAPYQPKGAMAARFGGRKIPAVGTISQRGVPVPRERPRNQPLMPPGQFMRQQVKNNPATLARKRRLYACNNALLQAQAARNAAVAMVRR